MLLRAAALGLMLIFAVPRGGGAAEAICPGGSNHRSDIIWCADLEVTTGCTTGQEIGCWNNNGIQYRASNDLTIVRGRSDAAVGSGYVTADGVPGQTGSGFGQTYFSAAFSPSVAFRYYLRYSRGYASFYSGHNVQVEGAGDAGCFNALKFQLSSYSGGTYYVLSCGPNAPLGHFLYPNLGQPATMLNNQWHVVEVQGVLDTSCTNQGVQPFTGCNGSIRVWLDDVKISEETGLNMGGVASGGSLKWTFINFPEDYFHFTVPPWGFTQAWDNVVVSNDGTRIGCANTDGSSGCPGSAENARGTGDPASPYAITPFSGEAWMGRRRGQDCTGNSATGQGVSETSRWRDTSGTLDATRSHDLYPSICSVTIAGTLNPGYDGTRVVGELMTVTDGTDSTDCSTGSGSPPNTHNCRWNGAAWEFTTNTNNSLNVTLTGSQHGGGVYYASPNTVVFQQWASYGWIYLPSTNNYTVTNLALPGFVVAGTGGGDPAAGYVALTVSSGNWAVGQKNTSGVGGTVSTSTAVTLNAWHEYELMIWNNGSNGCATANGCVSLMIDRTRLLTKAALPQSAAWAFASNQPNVVVGIIDFQGTPPFTAYLDDNVVASVSAWSGDGWGAASDPFSGRTTLAHGVALGRGVEVR